MSRINPENLTLDEYQVSHIIFQYYNDYVEFQKFLARLDEEGVDPNFINNAFQEILRWAVSDKGAVQYAKHIRPIALHDYEKSELRSGKIALEIQDRNGEEYVKEFSLKQAAQIVDIVRHQPAKYHDLFRRLGYSEDVIREMEAWFSKWPFSALGCRVYGDYILRSAGRPVQSRITRGLRDLNSELRSNKITLKIKAFNGEEYVKEFSLKQAAQIADIVRYNPAEYQNLFKHLGYSNDTIREMGSWFLEWSYSAAGYWAYASYISQAALQPVRSRIAQSLRELDIKEMRALDADFSPATGGYAPRLVPLTRSNLNNYELHAGPASIKIENWRKELPRVSGEEVVGNSANLRVSEVNRGDRVVAQGAANPGENVSRAVRNAQRQEISVAWAERLEGIVRSAENFQANEVTGGNRVDVQNLDNPSSQIPNATITKRPGLIERFRKLWSSCFGSKVSPQ